MQYYNLKEIPSVPVNELHSLIGNYDWNVLKSEKIFDLNQLKNQYNLVKQNYGFRKKDGSSFYSGICLQCASDDTDPMYDQLDVKQSNTTAYAQKYIQMSNNLANHWTAAGLVFKNIIDFFEPYFSFYRGRILVADPKMLMPAHRDAPQSATLHIPIFSNTDCHLVVDGAEYYLEPDGSAYLVNIWKPHFMYNAGLSPRAHIIFSLPPMGFKKLLPLDKEKFSEYFQFKRSHGVSLDS